MMHHMNRNINFDCKAHFGGRLKEIRLSKGISQEALAMTAGLDRTYVSGCERGVRNIGLENIYRLAIALEVSPTLFFREANCESK
jgi:transcriptional regulator with XRE-family HTH domain